MPKDYIKKTHIQREGTDKPLCGAHLAEGTKFVSADEATCKNCKAVLIAEKRIEEEYPWIEVRKDKIVIHKSPAEIESKVFDDQLLDEEVSETYKSFINEWCGE